MDNRIELEPGTNLSNSQLCKIFKCSTQGGMRRATKTNTLVLVSNHVKSIYSDRWIDNVMHYTGMGTKGDQKLSFMQNPTLAQSNTNGVDLHLFEVLEEKIYTYRGQVKLDSSPYEENQLDEDERDRKVWVFPIRLITGNNVTISREVTSKNYTAKITKARRLTDEELRKKALSTGKTRVGKRLVSVIEYQRSPFVAEEAKRRAKGICELCRQPAPFQKKNGEPYLETHHIIWLAKGGEDTVNNTVALCPNCHKKMHSLNLQSDVNLLKEAIKSKS